MSTKSTRHDILDRLGYTTNMQLCGYAVIGVLIIAAIFLGTEIADSRVYVLLTLMTAAISFLLWIHRRSMRKIDDIFEDLKRDIHQEFEEARKSLRTTSGS